MYDLAKALKSTAEGIAVFEQLSPHTVGEFARVRLGSLKGYFLAERDEVVKARKCLDDLLAASEAVRKSSWDEIRHLRLLLASAYGRKGDFDAAVAQLKEQAAVLRTRGEWSQWARCAYELAMMTKPTEAGVALFDRLRPLATTDEAKCELVASKGAFLTMRNETGAAEKCLRELLANPVLKDRPWDDSIRWLRFLLCEAYERAGDKDAILAHLHVAAEQVGWEFMAHIVAHVGCSDEAREILDEMKAGHEAYVTLAEGMWRYGDFQRAKKVLTDIPQTAIDADPKLKEGISAIKNKMAAEQARFAEEFEELAQKAEADGNKPLGTAYVHLAKPYRQEEAQLLEEAK